MDIWTVYLIWGIYVLFDGIALLCLLFFIDDSGGEFPSHGNLAVGNAVIIAVMVGNYTF